jgi:hypothetical protein
MKDKPSLAGTLFRYVPDTRLLLEGRMTQADLQSLYPVNRTRYQAGQPRGHYESFFQRANHPTRPVAFWIRYTIFSPQGHPEDAVGELWAVYFDGEKHQHVVVKQAHPIQICVFDPAGFFVRVADSQLTPGVLQGHCTSNGHTISWDLAYSGDAEPIFLLPHRYYTGSFPKAKSLVGLPMARYQGTLKVDGITVDIADWVGSQNHNWGTQHTDYYAWGQVAGFDTHPDTFLEIASARLKLGPVWTPFITPIVLRHQGREFALNAMTRSLRTHVSLTYFKWDFLAENNSIRLEGTISAARDAFVGLRYANPPGGFKQCLNSKIAACTLKLTLKERRYTAPVEILSTAHRAAFEILTDDSHHGVTIHLG